MEKEVQKQRPKVVSRTQPPQPGLRTLEKKNKQLSNATKELEEKMLSLRQRTQQRALPKVRRI